MTDRAPATPPRKPKRFYHYDDILWPYIYAPMGFVLLTHVGVRIPWAFGIGGG